MVSRFSESDLAELRNIPLPAEERQPRPETEGRNADIRKLRAEGWTVRELALAYGISRQRVCQICERQ